MKTFKSLIRSYLYFCYTNRSTSSDELSYRTISTLAQSAICLLCFSEDSWQFSVHCHLQHTETVADVPHGSRRTDTFVIFQSLSMIAIAAYRNVSGKKLRDDVFFISLNIKKKKTIPID